MCVYAHVCMCVPSGLYVCVCTLMCICICLYTCVCMYVYTHVYVVHPCVYVCACVHSYVYMCDCVHWCLYVCMLYSCMQMCMYTYVYVYCVHSCICVYVRICTLVCMCTCMYTHVYMCVHSCVCVGMCEWWCVCGGHQKTWKSLISLSTIRVLGVEISMLGSHSKHLSPSEPSCWPSLLMNMQLHRQWMFHAAAKPLWCLEREAPHIFFSVKYSVYISTRASLLSHGSHIRNNRNATNCPHSDAFAFWWPMCLSMCYAQNYF